MLRLVDPCFADELVWREAAKGLEAACVVAGVDEVGEVRLDLPVAVVVVALDGRFLDCAVHPFDLTVRPRVLPLGEPVLDAVLLAAHVEHVGDILRGWPVGVARREGKLDAVVGEDRVDLVGHGIERGSYILDELEK